MSGQAPEQLPFTGLETLWLALIGAGMLALGLVLRVRVASQADGASESDARVSGTDGGTQPDHAPSTGVARVATHGKEGDGFPLAGFETLGLMLIGAGHARLRAGPQGTFVVAMTAG